MAKKIAVIGAGFSGISAACALAKIGYAVTVFEKNAGPGGRASVFTESGFTFDMGPSWYWMPDVFEWFFGLYGKKPSDYYTLDRLDPSYRIFFDEQDITDMPASLQELKYLFEGIEPGSSEQLVKFLASAKYKYDIGMRDLIFKPCNSVFEFSSPALLNSLFKVQLFTSLRKDISRRFKNKKLQKILEFPAYFLGASPAATPALYSMLNYADLVLGTWYPQGGMYRIITAMVDVAEEMGVRFHYDSPVQKIHTEKNIITAINVGDEVLAFDGIIASADYAHVEQKLLEPAYRNYSEAYWNKRTFAPSSLIFYLGVNGKVNNLLHHNLFFDASFESFSDSLNEHPTWPADPLFYVCCPSKTDSSVAPEGRENLFILMPVAAGLDDTEATREKYFELIMQRLESHTKENIRHRIAVKSSFAHNDFSAHYNAFKGNAYGLANTLRQTAILKPAMKNKKLKNLFYAGQLTVPGPGIPPSIISGYIAAGEMSKLFNQ